MNKVLVYVASGLLAAAVGFFAVFFLKPLLTAAPAQVAVSGGAVSSDESSGRGGDNGPSDNQQPIDSTVVVINDEPSTTEDVTQEQETVSAPVLSKTGHSVTQTSLTAFTVKLKVGKNAPKEAEYVLSDQEKHRYVSSTGKFDNVAPNAKGSYTAVLRDKQTGLSSTPVTVSGFILQSPVVKLTASEVEANLNTGNRERWEEIKDRFVANPKISCFEAGEKSEKKRMSEIYMSVSMDGYRAYVSNISYDFLGRISSMTVNLR